ncbi:sensor histidine kinase [Edaphobacter aggregans]|uniref:sensor histidine kinase n=1 Tax=Edaphobacter aggregans TaxID=570835 RepID=UPI00054D4E73|nr:sensor histidine kinase [Edaphobacter aggregans]
MDASPARTQPPQWLWVVTIWSAVGLFDATENVFVMRAEGMHHYWGRLYFYLLVSWLPWALATPLVLRLARRYPPTKLRPLSTWVRHILAGVSIGLAFSTWTAALEVLLNPWAKMPGPGTFLQIQSRTFYNGLLACAILYTTLLLVGYLLDSRERLARQQTETARLNEQLVKAQLSALRHQIEPHFLFNTLNSIAGLVRERRNDDAVSMIVELSDFMRRVLKDSSLHHVPLSEELDFARKYLDIQKVRFVDRLHCSIEVPDDLLLAQVPTLILQPMVENAIKHGIARRAHGGAIRILASRGNDKLTLSVYNDGPSLPANGTNVSTGIGISNIRTRLESLYGDNFEFTMQNQPPGGVQVSVSVPFKE